MFEQIDRPKSRFLRPLIAAFVALVALTAYACSVNPATGKRQTMMVSQAQEVAMGQQAHPQILAQYGIYPDEDLQRYVSDLGMELAKASERPDLPWTFTVLDDPVVNAFALPGGYIYITRGILSHMASEAELISVLGHEIGHVTARHGAERMSKAQLAQIGMVVGAVASEEFRQYGQLVGAGMQLLFLKYGRDDERQADDLGFRYLINAGYDPREMTEMFTVLESVSAASGAERLPNWLSTHPAPTNRIGRIQDQIAGQIEPIDGRTVNREEFLAMTNGIVFGADPREGFFIGNAFYHPGLKFQLTFPEGWKTQNQKQAVVAMSPNEDALVALTLAGGSTASDAAEKFFSQQGIKTLSPWRRRIGGFPAFAANFATEPPQAQPGQPAPQNPNLRGLAAFLDADAQVYRLLGYTQDGRWNSYGQAFGQSIGSFKPLKNRRYLDVQPARVELVKMRQDMSLEEFARRYPSTVDLSKLAIINHIRTGQNLKAGQSYKRVVGGEIPTG